MISRKGEAQGPALVWCPFPDEQSAITVAKTLLDERLIACANIFPAVLSLFEWGGERGETSETGVLMKTDASLLETVIDRIAALHTYDEPAIVGWRCDAASAGTQAWLGSLAP